MNKLKTTRVQLPDGRLVTLQGSDEGTARVLVNHYLGQGEVAAETDEDPLTVPGLGCETDSGVSCRGLESVIHNIPPQPAANADAEEPLEMPVMNFRNEPKSTVKSDEPAIGFDEAPLEMPTLKF